MTDLNQSNSRGPAGQSADLRARIAKALQGESDDGFTWEDWLDLADAVIRELETSFVHCRAKETSPGVVPKTVAAVSAPGEDLIDFGLWLSEELTGTPMSRIDLESCLQDWKEGR